MFLKLKGKKMKIFKKLFFSCLLLITFNRNVYAMENDEKPKINTLPIRECSRLIILDEQNRLLLMQIKLDKPADSLNPITKPYWVTLGGGVESNETLEEAAARELYEETGIKNSKIGPKIWHGQWRGANRINDETYFLVRLPYVGGTLDHSGFGEEEKKVIKMMRWWTIDEIKQSDEIIIPQHLSTYLSNILKGELPLSPIEIDLSTPMEK